MKEKHNKISPTGTNLPDKSYRSSTRKQRWKTMFYPDEEKKACSPDKSVEGIYKSDEKSLDIDELENVEMLNQASAVIKTRREYSYSAKDILYSAFSCTR